MDVCKFPVSTPQLFGHLYSSVLFYGIIFATDWLSFHLDNRNTMKKMKMFFGFLLVAGLLIILSSGFSRPRKAKKNTTESGTILGIVVPLTVKTAVYAISVTDTIAAAITDTTNGAYLLKDVPSGNYALIFVPVDHDYLKNSTRAFVSEGQITIADTMWLRK